MVRTGLAIGISICDSNNLSGASGSFSPSWNYSDSRNSQYAFTLIWW